MVENIRDAIKLLAKPDADSAALICTVDAVDKDARTVDCSPIDESAPLLGVNLQANRDSDFGVCLFPEIGSFVVVGFVARGAAGVVLLCDKIESAEIVIDKSSVFIDKDSITLNRGKLGGLIKIKELTEKLNELTETVNNLISNYNNHIHPATDSVGSTCVIAPTASSAQAALKFDQSDYENSKVKH